MSKMTNYLENALVNHVLRATPFTSPTNIYIGLFTSGPQEDGSGTEVSGGSYERQLVTFSAPNNGTTYNTNVISFPIATADWGTIVGFGLFDAQSGGNMLLYGTLVQAKTINVGDQFVINIGNLTVTFD